MKKKVKRVTSLDKLKQPTKEGRALAEQAMKPFLKDMQKAADEQFDADFGGKVRKALEPKEKPERKH